MRVFVHRAYIPAMEPNTPLHRVMRAEGLRDTQLARRLADRGCPISSQQICRVRRGTSKASPELARALEHELAGKVTRADLRPDIFDTAPSLADRGELATSFA